jgi:hypothetical protein
MEIMRLLVDIDADRPDLTADECKLFHHPGHTVIPVKNIYAFACNDLSGRCTGVSAVAIPDDLLELLECNPINSDPQDMAKQVFTIL